MFPIPVPAPAPAREVIVIDAAIADWSTLVAGLDPRIDVILLPAGGDGLAALELALADYGTLDALHLVSHGADGQLRLGALRLDGGNLGEHAAALGTIAGHLAAGADVLLYGCSVAASPAGQAFVAALSAALGGVDVAASADATGALALAGDWDLEYWSGQIETMLPFADADIVAYNGAFDDASDEAPPVPPQVTIATSSGVLKVGQTAVITFTFSAEPSAAFTSDIVIVSGGTLGAMSGTGLTRTAVFTPTAATDAGTANVSIAAGTWYDTANVPGEAGAKRSFFFDTKLPTLTSITAPADGTYAAGSFIDLKLNYSESVYVTSTSGAAYLFLDIGIIGTAQAIYLSGSGTPVITVRHTVTGAEFDADGISIKPTFRSAGIVSAKDGAGNLVASSAAVAAPGVLVDGVAPKVTSIVRAGAASTSATSASYTVTFAENVTGVDASDFALSLTGSATGSIASAVTGSGNVYSVTVDGIGGDGTLRLDLKSSGSGIVDAAGNPALAGYTAGEAYTIVPLAAAPAVLSVAAPADAIYTPGQHLDFVVKFSAPVTVDTGGGTPSIAVALDTGGTLQAAYISGSGSTDLVFRFTVAVGMADVSGVELGAAIGLNGATVKGSGGGDAALALNGVAVLDDVQVYGIVPGAPGTPDLLAGSDSGVTNDNITNATTLRFLGAGASGDTTSTVRVFLDANGNGSYDAGTDPSTTPITSALSWQASDLVTTGVGDGAYNIYAFATSSTASLAGPLSAALAVTLDTVAPTMVITSNAAALKVGASATITFAFTEDPLNTLVAGEIVTTGGTLGALSGSGLTRTATFTPTASTNNGAASIAVAANRYTDKAGNNNTATAATPILTYDTLAPAALSLTLAQDTGTSGSDGITRIGTVNLSGIESGASWQFSTDGGAAWQAGSGSSFTLGGDGAKAVLARQLDAAGNTGAAGALAFTLAAAAPTGTVSLDRASVNAGQTALVTISFDTPVTALTLNDLAVSHGSLGTPASSDGGRTWTSVFTPSADVAAALNAVALDTAGVTSIAGTAGSATARSGNFSIDTQRPTATLALSDSALANGERAVVTVTFSESVTALASSAFTLSHASLGAFTSADGGTTWRATLTPADAVSAANNSISFSAADVRDAAGNSGSGSASASYSVQTQLPAPPPAPQPEPEPEPEPEPAAPGGGDGSTIVDGVAVIVTVAPASPATGLANQAVTVPITSATRADDPASLNPAYADIPLGLGAGALATTLLVSLPSGSGLHADGATTLLSNSQALVDLAARITAQGAAGSTVQADMAQHSAAFLAELAPEVQLISKTLAPAVAPGTALSAPIYITGSSSTPAPGAHNSTAIAVVIDMRALPTGATLHLNDVDFAAIVGAATLRGGAGSNYVVGDAAAQNMLLGADDDILYGGGGHDIIGSAGGDDLLDGGAGDDGVVGGIGNDKLYGGSGNDVLQGGRSDQGQWQFYLNQAGNVVARHQMAMFAPNQVETVQLAELQLVNAGLSFLSADKALLVDVALLYQAVLQRAPDVAGLNYWVATGAGSSAVANGLLGSAEAGIAGTPQLSDRAFVEGMYQQVLGRSVEAAGLAYWVGQLAGAGAVLSRADVLLNIALSAEHRQLRSGADGYALGTTTVGQERGWFNASGDDRLDGGLGSDVLVGGDGVDTVVYRGALADYTLRVGIDGTILVADRLNGDTDTLIGIEAGSFSDGTVDLAFLQGPTAGLQQIGLLYQAVFDRPGDLGGVAWWLGQHLDVTGLALGFTGTSEFKADYDGMSNASFVHALFSNSGLTANAAGGELAWETYLATHTRAELIASWITVDGVIAAQFGTHGLWLA